MLSRLIGILGQTGMGTSEERRGRLFNGEVQGFSENFPGCRLCTLLLCGIFIESDPWKDGFSVLYSRSI